MIQSFLNNSGEDWIAVSHLTGKEVHRYSAVSSYQKHTLHKIFHEFFQNETTISAGQKS